MIKYIKKETIVFILAPTIISSIFYEFQWLIDIKGEFNNCTMQKLPRRNTITENKFEYIIAKYSHQTKLI